MTIVLLLGAAMLAPGSSSFTVEGVASPTVEGMIPQSVATSDLDGDGAAGRGTLPIHCSGSSVIEALFANVKGPRDAGSGIATGKRTHIAPASL